LCQLTSGTNRFECNGAGPVIPTNQQQVNLGDCNYQGQIIASGKSICIASTGLERYARCSNGSATIGSCGQNQKCSNGSCINVVPIISQNQQVTKPPSPTPVYSTTGNEVHGCMKSADCPAGWACTGPVIPYGGGYHYCEKKSNNPD